MIKPIRLKVGDYLLLIDWEKVEFSKIRLFNLRRAVSCANCAIDMEEHGSSYHPIFTDDKVATNKIELIGEYAIFNKWKDDHYI